MSRKIAIGDIHGCHNTFIALLDQVRLTHSDTLYLLGDYIDRGKNPKKVIDTIIDLINSGYNVKPLIGNHEFMLLESHEFSRSYMHWITQGGHTTITSFQNYFDLSYFEFFKNLEYFYLEKDFVLVHGGLDFSQEKPLEHKDAIVWTRNKSIDKDKIGGRRLIVGHTPTGINRIKQSLNEDIIFLDGGCIYPDRGEEFGNLVALDFTNMHLIIQCNIEV